MKRKIQQRTVQGVDERKKKSIFLSQRVTTDHWRTWLDLSWITSNFIICAVTHSPLFFAKNSEPNRWPPLPTQRKWWYFFNAIICIIFLYIFSNGFHFLNYLLFFSQKNQNLLFLFHNLIIQLCFSFPQ